MADLPSNSPQMFQLPAPAQISQQPGLFQGLASGLDKGAELGLQARALAQQQQVQQAQIKQMQFEKNMKTVEVLLPQITDKPALAPYYWPTLATAMNGISPDYQLDPKNPPPPEALKPFTAGLFQVMNGINDGSVSHDQGHMFAKKLIDDYIPKPVEMTPEQSINAAQQYIANAPLTQQGLLNSQLKESPQMKEFESGIEQKKQMAVAGQAQNQDAIRSLTSSFESQSQDAKNVFDNLNVFNSQMQLSRQFEGAKDTTGAVNAEKASLLAFAQMAYPGTGRPGNMEMLENMEKSGPYGTLISQALNKVSKGEIMTDSQIKGLRQAAVGIAQAREQSQTDQENTTAHAIRLHGGDPQAFLRNYRSSTIHSTSPLFPSQGTGHPLIGQTVKGYRFLGGDPADKENWASASGNE